MRMVIEVPEQLHAAVKERAASEGRPMSQAVRQLLENYVGQAKAVQMEGKKVISEMRYAAPRLERMLKRRGGGDRFSSRRRVVAERVLDRV